jgi:hypothetical protein
VLCAACSGDFTNCHETRPCKPAASGGDAGAPGAAGLGADDSAGGDRSNAGGTSSDPDGGEPTAAGGQPTSDTCGDGKVDATEDCDLGAENDPAAYGEGKCTDRCVDAPFCGDGKKNGDEACDGGVQSQELGSCNPECTGYYEKKFIRVTFNTYPAGELGGIVGADAKCELELGAGWKALIVGGGRRATVTPLKGDGAKDWVLQKYTHYFSYYEDKLLWRTDELPLLGVRDGKRVNVYAAAFASADYPSSGWASDWTTLPDDAAKYQGTCAGWTSTSAGWATFTRADLTQGQSESCSTAMPLLCVEQ